jgi:hypothetical protein
MSLITLEIWMTQFILRTDGTFATFFPIYFFNFLDMKSSSKFHTVQILLFSLQFLHWPCGYDIWLSSECLWVRFSVKPLIFFPNKCYSMQFYIFICNKQELSKFSYSIVYLVKYTVPLFFWYKQDKMSVTVWKMSRNIIYYWGMLRLSLRHQIWLSCSKLESLYDYNSPSYNCSNQSNTMSVTQ